MKRVGLDLKCFLFVSDNFKGSDIDTGDLLERFILFLREQKNIDKISTTSVSLAYPGILDKDYFSVIKGDPDDK